MNSHQKNDIKDVMDWLVEMFPNAFFKTANKVKPLGLGVMDDLLDFYERLSVPPFSKKHLRLALTIYTGQKAYLKSQKEGAFRINLNGQAISVVDKEQASYASEKLAKKRQKSESSKPAGDETSADFSATKSPEQPQDN